MSNAGNITFAMIPQLQNHFTNKDGINKTENKTETYRNIGVNKHLKEGN